MGAEIEKTIFSKKDFQIYKENLLKETNLLETWFKERKFSNPSSPHIGLELEGCLINQKGEPCPKAKDFLKSIKTSQVVPELSLFNFEINANHYPLSENTMDLFSGELQKIQALCQKAASSHGLSPVFIGTLPSLTNDFLSLDFITPQKRYYALNHMILSQRNGLPLQVNINGDQDILRESYDSILLESSATSLQIHLEVPQEEAVNFYNASILASPFTVAICANSPFLCGHELWDETRIPIFEQTIIVGVNAPPLAKKRVTLGTGYLEECLSELYLENYKLYPPLLPCHSDERPENMAHVNFHNGTIWRWNRPIIGFDSKGLPQLRIEHRAIPAGPSLEDTLANILLFLGLVHSLKNWAPLMTKQISFVDTYINFYESARRGLSSQFLWKNNREKSLKDIFIKELSPHIRKSLKEIGISSESIKHYFDGIILERVKSGQNGAKWQKSFVKNYGRDYKNLVLAYLENQQNGKPVHLWNI